MLLQRILSRAAGALTGAVTGLFAGFIPGYYRLYRKARHLVDNALAGAVAGALFLYVATLPFLMIFHMGKGFMSGLMGGFLAGLSYPKKLNDEYQIEKQRLKLARKFLSVKEFYRQRPLEKGIYTEEQRTELEAGKKSTKFIYGGEGWHSLSHSKLKDKKPRPVFLKEQDLESLENIINEKSSFDSRVNELKAIRKYKEHASKACPLTGKPLSELSQPVAVRFRDAESKISEVICESSAVEELMRDHLDRRSFFNRRFGMKENLPAASILINDAPCEIVEFKPYAYPKQIAEFIVMTRKKLEENKNKMGENKPKANKPKAKKTEIPVSPPFFKRKQPMDKSETTPLLKRGRSFSQ